MGNSSRRNHATPPCGMPGTTHVPPRQSKSPRVPGLSVARPRRPSSVWGFDQGAAEAYWRYAAGAAAGRNAAMTAVSAVVPGNRFTPSPPCPLLPDSNNGKLFSEKSRHTALRHARNNPCSAPPIQEPTGSGPFRCETAKTVVSVGFRPRRRRGVLEVRRRRRRREKRRNDGGIRGRSRKGPEPVGSNDTKRRSFGGARGWRRQMRHDHPSTAMVSDRDVSRSDSGHNVAKWTSSSQVAIPRSRAPRPPG